MPRKSKERKIIEQILEIVGTVIGIVLIAALIFWIFSLIF